jgi:glutathione S-transferase
MMLKLIMGNKNYSSWSIRPWSFLTAHGIPFEAEVIALGTEEFAREVPKRSPSGRVPVLMLEDGSAVYDSLVIGEYLADQGHPVWPKAQHVRNRARSACAEMHAGFTELRRVLTCNARARYMPESWKDYDPASVPAVEADILRMEALLESMVAESGGPFLGGKTFGYVDAYFVPVVSRFQTYGITLRSSVAEGYAQQIKATAVFQTWMRESAAESLTVAKYEYNLPRLVP